MRPRGLHHGRAAGPCANRACDSKFVEETDASGIESRYQGDWEYMVGGGGVAAFDCNDDGYEDLYLAGGEAKAPVYCEREQARRRVAFQAPGQRPRIDASPAAIRSMSTATGSRT